MFFDIMLFIYMILNLMHNLLILNCYAVQTFIKTYGHLYLLITIELINLAAQVVGKSVEESMTFFFPQAQYYLAKQHRRMLALFVKHAANKSVPHIREEEVRVTNGHSLSGVRQVNSPLHSQDTFGTRPQPPTPPDTWHRTHTIILFSQMKIYLFKTYFAEQTKQNNKKKNNFQ